MRVAFFTAATIGVGHGVRAVAIERALRRRRWEGEFRVFRPVSGVSGPTLPGEVRVPMLADQLADREKAGESAIFRALRAYAPDLVLVDLFWAPMHHVLAQLTCEAWLLLHKCPDGWMHSAHGLELTPSRYAHILGIEPAAHPAVTRHVSPVVVCNPDETFPRDAFRTRFGVREDEWLTVRCHAGRSGEIESLPNGTRAGRVETLSWSNEREMFPLAKWLTGADEIFCGAGYNSFWEARWLGYAARVHHTAFERPVDDQSWRVRQCADVRPESNGADEIAAMVTALPAAKRLEWQYAIGSSVPSDAGNGTNWAPGPPEVGPFARLIAPFPTDEFLRVSIGRAFRHWPGESARAATLVRPSDTERLLFRARADLAHVQLFERGHRIETSRIVQEERGATKHRVKELSAALRRGAEARVDGVDRLHDPVRRLVEDVEWLVRAPVTASLIATWAASQPLSPWRDADDLLYVQVGGRSALRILGRGLRDPSVKPSSGSFVGTAENAPGDDAVWDDWLEDGDTLYLPRGTWHSRAADAGEALVLVLRWSNPRGHQFGAWLGERLRFRAAARGDVPRGATGAELQRYVDSLKVELSALCTVENLERFLREHDRTAPVRSWTSVDSLAAVHSLAAGRDAAVESRVRIAQLPVVLADRDAVEWPVNGGYWTYPRAYEPLLRALTERREWPIDALRGRAQLGSDDAFVSAVAQLVEDGLAAIRRGSTGG